MSGLQTFFEVMMLDTPGHNQTWSSHSKHMLSAAKNHMQMILDEAREEVRHIVCKANEIDYDQCIDAEIGVSFDGTWSQRGFTANHGIGFVISVDTGKVLDFEVLSKVCLVCHKNPKADDQWKLEYKPFCTKSHAGSSKSIETVAAKRI